MLDQYGPILIFIAIAAIFPPALLWIAKFFRPSFKPTAEKVMPYECGVTPESDARGRYAVRFYVVAILFVVFEVETVFLYPWAVQFQVLGLLGLVEMLVFLGLWTRGALDWV
jgi:NADH-quinone oxidoreductase subunit A